MKNPLLKGPIEDFWKDCYDMKETKEKIGTQRCKYNPFYYRRNENYKYKNNKLYSINLSSKQNQNNTKRENNNINKTHNNITINSNIKKIYKNHPMLKEYIKNNNLDKESQLKRKNAMFRCLGLYVYGVEVKKVKLLDNEKNKKDNINNEISSCTFRPKISAYSKSKKPQYYMDLNNKNKNQKNNSIKYKKINGMDNYNIKNDDDTIDLEECTFKPKINKKNYKKVFNKSRSLANEKDNTEFYIRLNKARKNYMIKKLNLLFTKDDSYDFTLLTLANEINNKPNKNRTIDVYNMKLDKNHKKRNLSMNDYNDNSFINNKKQINLENNIKYNLRNALLSINLSDEE